jgi:hypothetical protein
MRTAFLSEPLLLLLELIRRKRIEELQNMMGSVKLEIDIPESRRRPPPSV